MYRGRFIPGDFHALSEAAAHDRADVPSGGVSGKRIACLLVADFPVAAIARLNPELRERPFALTRMPSPRRERHRAKSGPDYQPHSEVSHVSSIAHAAGLRPGMTVAHARALIPELAICHPSSAAEESASGALLDAAESMSPVVEEGAPGCVWIDLTGAERVFRRTIDSGDPVDDIETSMAEELIRRARRVGLDAAAAIASSKETAYLAARCGGARVIAPGREREFLDWMPLELTGLGAAPDGENLEMTFKRLGLRRLGDLARLDIRAIGSRFGNRGVELARLARGEGSATVITRARGETFSEASEFEYGIDNLEALGFVMRTMLQQLTERLRIRGLAAGDMTLSLGLADRGRDERRVAVAAATTEMRSLLMLMRLSLEAAPPSSAVESVCITVEPRTARLVQNDMFIPPSPAPDKLEAALARIAAMCGPDRVGMLMPADSYRPEAVRLGIFAPPMPSIANAMQPESSVTRMVIRTVRPAEEIEVMCTRAVPEFVRGRNICARVVSAAGPWRRQGEWWSAAMEGSQLRGEDAGRWRAHTPDAYARDYYELALEDGAVYRVYCDLNNARWFVDGIYD